MADAKADGSATSDSHGMFPASGEFQEAWRARCEKTEYEKLGISS